MTYNITDYIVTTGSGAKEAYTYARDISSSWNVEFNKSAELLKTKKYIIMDKTTYSSVKDALDNIDYSKLSDFNFTSKQAACYILTDNRYLFVSFAKDKTNG
jgi:hypothetical protein